MIASVHFADVRARAIPSVLRASPKPTSTSGLRFATTLLAAPLRRSLLPSPALGRIGLVAFWDDALALDRFLVTDPVVAKLSEGWHVRLKPLRAWGSWPGLPHDLPRTRVVEHVGPTAVLTLGRLRPSQAIRFVRTSAKAEAQVVDAPGLIWATGLGWPPVVATFSLWQTTDDLSTYAYGREEAPHPRDRSRQDEAVPPPIHLRQVPSLRIRWELAWPEPALRDAACRQLTNS